MNDESQCCKDCIAMHANWFGKDINDAIAHIKDNGTCDDCQGGKDYEGISND